MSVRCEVCAARLATEERKAAAQPAAARTHADAVAVVRAMFSGHDVDVEHVRRNARDLSRLTLTSSEQLAERRGLPLDRVILGGLAAVYLDGLSDGLNVGAERARRRAAFLAKLGPETTAGLILAAQAELDERKLSEPTDERGRTADVAADRRVVDTLLRGSGFDAQTVGAFGRHYATTLVEAHGGMVPPDDVLDVVCTAVIEAFALAALALEDARSRAR